MKKIFVTISLMMLSGCSLFNIFERDNSSYWLNNIRSYKTYPVNYYQYDEKNDGEKLIESKTLNANTFQHNVVVSANLGQRMVDSQTYIEKSYGKDKMVISQDGEIYSISNSIKVKKGTNIKPLGEVKINGKYYLLIDIDESGNILLIDEKGKFVNQICQLYHGELLMPRYKANVSPKGLGIEQKRDIRKQTDDPKLQYDIKYDGLENGLMSFLYEDHSNPKSKNRQIQRFIFPQEQELLDINGMKFKIMDAFPNRIEYMILDK